MQHFRVIKLLGLILFMVNMTACWSPTAQKTDKLMANFVLESVQVDQQAYRSQMNGNDSWIIPDVVNYNIKACLKDYASNANLTANHRFDIFKNNGEAQRLYTDERGCVEWVEQLSFNFFGDEKNILLSPVLQGEKSGVYKGRRQVRLVVNPWSTISNTGIESYWWKDELTEDHIIAKFGDIVAQKDAVAQALSGASGEYPLWIKNLKFNSSKAEKIADNTGIAIEMDLSFNPVIQKELRDGTLKEYSYLKGKYKVFAHIISTGVGEDNKQHSVLTTHQPALTCDPTEKIDFNNLPVTTGWCVVEKDGSVRLLIRSNIAAKMTQGNLKLAFRVEPLEVTNNIKGFAGLYFLGSYSNISGNKSPILRATGDQSFDFSEYLQAATNYQELIKVRNAMKLEPYDFSVADVRFERVSPGETATRRTIQFRVRSCVSDNFEGSKLIGKKFFIYRNGKILDNNLSDGTPVNYYQTDDEGCLNLPGVATHSYYVPEQLMGINYKIVEATANKPQELKQGVYQRNLKVWINPWDEKWTFGRDDRVLSYEYRESVRTAPKIPSRFFISHFGYQTLNFGYEIDEYMNLKVKKMVLLNMDPWVLRYSGIVGGRNTKYPLRDGLYLMKIALQKDYLDPAAKGVIIKPRLEDHPLVQNGKKEVPPFQNDLKYQTWDNRAERFKDLRQDQLPRIRKQFVTTLKKIVRVNNGKIITPIELSVSDLRLMRIRSNFFVQLEPIDERLVFIANNYDHLVSQEIRENLRQDFNNKIQDLAKKKGREYADSFEKMLQDQFGDIQDYQKLRVLSRKDQDAHEQKILDAQKRLNNMIQNLQSRVAGAQSLSAKEIENVEGEFGPTNIRKVDDPEFLKSVLTTNNIYEETMRDFQLTDFTVTSAAPLFEDLDLLIEPPEVSGLKRRTFVGPLTFLLNSNSSNVRPTDNLDEKMCLVEDSCNNLVYYGINAQNILYRMRSEGRGEERNEKYVNSIRHMADVHVDNLIEEQKKLEFRYKREQEVNSNIVNYVNLHGVQFVSLADEPLYNVNPECTSIYEPNFFRDCYVEEKAIQLQGTDDKNFYSASKIPSQAFIDKINNLEFSQIGAASWRRHKPEVTKESIKQVLRTGKMSRGLREAFCYMLANQAFKGQPPKRLMDYLPDAIGDRIPPMYSNDESNPFDYMMHLCSASADNETEPSVIIDRKIRINKIGNYVFLGGKQMNVNVGTTLNFNRSFSFSQNIGLALDALAKIGGNWLYDRTGPIKLGLDFKRAKAKTNSTTVSKQTFLVMQMAEFDIMLENYEYCGVVRWNPKAFQPMFKELIRNDSETYDYPGGFMICSGEDETEALPVREHYYYFTQHFTDGDMLDPGNIYNHPWLLSLRGTRDASAFLSRLESQDNVLIQLSSSMNDHALWPIKKMIDVYLKVLPTFPKFYSLIDDSYLGFERSFPNDTTPEDTFKMAEAEVVEVEDSSLTLALPGFEDSRERSNFIGSDKDEALIYLHNELEKLEQEKSSN